MDYYFSTSFFTLIPTPIFKEEDKDKYLMRLFNLDNDSVSKYIKIEKTDAFLVYSIPKAIENWLNEEKQIYPLALYFYNELMNIPAHNKVILSVDKRHLITHIAAAEGNNLKLINTYHTGNFTSALYYLFLALKMLQMNPALTHIKMYNNLSSNQMVHLKNYFNTIEVIEPSCNIVSLR